ncbi:sensor histidine kinase [Kineosporia sp. R_H_3]|uniref:sensor histidine kinase n=1 Tax=Kineosporia sp. R_H_3 TaxID=1961848 RepID=UPI000B4AF6DE|nr:histidine kinase [Kineosporia sp. R_H_3]
MTPVAAVRAATAHPVVRARAADALYGAFCLADAVSAAQSTWSDHGAWAGLGVGAAGLTGTALVVLLRRTRPVLVVLCTIPLAFAGGLDGAVILALFALAVRRRDRVLAGLAGLCWVAVGAAQITQDSSNWAAGFIAGAVIIVLAVVGGAYVGARRDLLASLRDRAEQAEATALLLQRQARLAERTLIAREMHDVVAHRISLVALHAGALEVNPASGPERVEQAAALIGTTARQALEDLRGVLGVLRSDPDAPVPEAAGLAPQPRLEDVPRLVEASVAAGVPVTFEDLRPAGAPPVDEVVGRTVYRVVQEALTNVHKHARSARTRVVVSADDPGLLRVEVTNVRPVAGSMLVPGSGTGLVGLRERVGLAGGTLDAGPVPGGGWSVRATFPGRQS